MAEEEAPPTQQEEAVILPILGLTLPRGMTLACLRELSGILNQHCRDDEDQLDEECAVRVYEVVLKHLG